MKIVRFAALILLLCLVSLPGISQKENWPGTLLWKIERSDLKKPSFLFGTMHLQDKRLFNLGDSFYYHFERAEGFAIEVDFKEYMDSLMNRVFASLEEREMNDDDGPKVEVKDEIKDVRIDTTSGELNLPPPPPAELKNFKFSKKYFRKIRNERIKRLLIYGEMPTILDAYLYGMAMKQGKWLGAVEEVKDQLNLKDELGKDLDEEDINQSEDRMLFSLDNMIKIYLAQDLNKIEEYALNDERPRVKTILFNNRNLKMAHSIDSLSHNRSMFYAVGAAHLPGDSGVIKLLRQNGYTVTPVYSKKTQAAEKYAEGLPSLSWYQVGQTDSLYTVDMPGIPNEYNVFGDLVKMKVLVDMTTMNFYMIGHTISQFDENKLTDALKTMGNSMGGGGKVENIKKVDRDGLKAVEGTIAGRGVYFRVQVISNNSTAFFLLLGSSKKPALSTAEANKFFNSFKANKQPEIVKQKDWTEFDVPEKAFTVSMPGKPKRNKLFEKQAENTGWNFSVYDYTDLSAGLYYIMQVRDVDAGLSLDGDSVYFSSFVENLGNAEIETIKEDYTKFNGFPAMRLDAVTKKNDLFYKTKNIIRGNRVYSLMVLGHISKKEEKGPDAFFDSFRFSEYKPAESRIHFSADHTFNTKAPAGFKLAKKDEEEAEDSTKVHYSSYNEYEATSYEVLKEVMSKYYWSENDSSFFKQKANVYKGYEDSLVSYKKIVNGNLHGVEQVIQSPGSNNLKRSRFLLHGDTLYTLISHIPAQYINNKTHSDFFEQFRVNNDKIKTTVFNSKAEKLLQALKSADSASFAEAKEYLSDGVFTKKELPFLHQALLYDYADDSLSWGTVTGKLINILDGLSDSSTVDFVRSNYGKTNFSKGDSKMTLLNVLADQKTTYSYALLKDLLVNKTPVNLKERKSIGYQVNDSLELTKTLYPEILGLLKNKDLWQDISDYTSELLDSNMLSSDILKPNQKELLYIADTLLNGTEIREEERWMWPYKNLLNLLGYVNTAEANSLLQKYAAEKDLYLKQAAVISLFRNNQPVDAKEIEKLAADKSFRKDFYDELKKIGKESFFTTKYRTQKYFAEANLFSYGEDDYSPSGIEFIGEREVVFGGEKKRIFLFKVIFTYEEEGEKPKKETYLGIAGPFSLDSKELETNSDATEILYDEEYDKKELERQFKELLSKGEEYIKKQSK